MWDENSVLYSDLSYMTEADFIGWKQLRGKTFYITGGTGLIGYYLIQTLLYRNAKFQDHIRILALVRNPEKARAMYERQIPGAGEFLQFVQGDVTETQRMEDSVDFLIHGASPTASRYFVEHPLETLETAIQGTSNMLHLAEEKQVKKMVYLSSMEVYGDHQSEDKISEEEAVCLHPMNLRDSYPIGKCTSENLC